MVSLELPAPDIKIDTLGQARVNTSDIALEFLAFGGDSEIFSRREI